MQSPWLPLTAPYQPAQANKHCVPASVSLHAHGSYTGGFFERRAREAGVKEQRVRQGRRKDDVMGLVTTVGATEIQKS